MIGWTVLSNANTVWRLCLVCIVAIPVWGLFLLCTEWGLCLVYTGTTPVWGLCLLCTDWGLCLVYTGTTPVCGLCLVCTVATLPIFGQTMQRVVFIARLSQCQVTRNRSHSHTTNNNDMAQNQQFWWERTDENMVFTMMTMTYCN